MSSSRSSRFNGNWSSSRFGDSNRSSSWGINMMYWQVGGCNTEAHGIRNVVHSLNNSIGVNVAVASPGDSIGSLHLLLGLCGVGKAIVVLSKVVLSVELRVGSVNSSWCSHNGRGRGLNNSRGSSSNSLCGGQVVAVVGGIGQVGVADLRSNYRCSGCVRLGHNWQTCSSRNRRSFNSNRSGSRCRSSSRSSGRSINDMNWKVCGTNTEAKSICNVVHSLDNSVGVNIAVSSSGHTICCFDLLLHRVGVTVAVAVLANVILTVVLRSFRCCSMDNRSSCHNWCSHRSSDRSSNIVNLLSRLRCNRGNRLLGKDHRCGHCNRSYSRSVVQREILRLDSSSGISLRVGDGMRLLGGGHFRCVHNRDRQGHSALGKICAGNSETCSIGNVLDSLHHTGGVHITISASNNSISCLNLLPH